MSRVAKKPIPVPLGVEVNINNQSLTVKAGKGVLERNFNIMVKISFTDNVLTVSPNESEQDQKAAMAMAGTVRALAHNMLLGVTEGFEKKLQLVGVGYRAQVQGKVLNLSLGFSHPINYQIPEGITIETPSLTEIVVKGIDKQLVGQVAADIRAYRPPEPYKGKGIRYANEVIQLKEGKKK